MVHAAQLCREGGTPAQLAAVLSTAAMVCWQAGDFEQARAFVAEAEPLHRDNRRIARVVWLSVAAALELERGDVARLWSSPAARTRRAPPSVWSASFRCCAAFGRWRAWPRRRHGAGEPRPDALQAAQALTYTFPTALCLETAAAVLHARRAAGGSSMDASGLATLFDAADAIRVRGDRPMPPSLAPELAAIHDVYARASDGWRQRSTLPTPPVSRWHCSTETNSPQPECPELSTLALLTDGRPDRPAGRGGRRARRGPPPLWSPTGSRRVRPHSPRASAANGAASSS